MAGWLLDLVIDSIAGARDEYRSGTMSGDESHFLLVQSIDYPRQPTGTWLGDKAAIDGASSISAPGTSERRHILFVDDEPQVLDGLRRMLSATSDSWQLSFVVSGEEALQLMQHTRIDAVVSDMAMPGMDGAQLLARVRELYPATARLMLSDGTDPDRVFDVVSSAHQYLTKPCDGLTLTTAVSQALAAQLSLTDTSLRELIGGVHALPTLPAVYEQIVAAVGRKDVRLAEIETIISSDVGTSAGILKLVNSAFFGLPREIYSIGTAVRLLGLDNIQALVLTSSLFHVNDALAWVLDVEDLRRQSLQRSAVARAIAQVEGWAGSDRDIATLSCLLRDVGRLVLAEGRPEATQQLQLSISNDLNPPSAARLAELETSAYGCTVAQASAYLLGLWRFSPAVVRTVADYPLQALDRPATKFTRVLDFASVRTSHPSEPYLPPVDGYMTQQRSTAWNIAADQLLLETPGPGAAPGTDLPYQAGSQ